MATGRTTADLSATRREHQSEEQARQPATGGKQLSVLEILRIGAKQFVDRYRDGGASWQVQGVLAKLTLCRTPALGGHEYRCNACNSTCIVANSCGDRHCPGCSGGKRFDFSERASKLLIDGVDYYQVVFTLPSELSRIALANRQPLANLLFNSAWKGLNKTIRREQEYEPAAIMVLHTWNQKLEAHWHVHALVPGSGPGTRNNQWKTSTAPPDSGLSDDHYLVDAINLRTAFRKAAISHLQRLRTRRKLKLDVDPKFGDLRTDEGWDKLIEHLSTLDWVSFIQPPPAGSSGPNDLVRYLTRYLTGGPISDSRIVTADEQQVTFLAREGKVQGGEAVQVPVTLSTTEFVRRWCLHIQPSQLTKTRYLGGWTNKQRESYRAKCIAQLLATAGLSGQPTPAESLTDEEESSADTNTKIKCPACGEAALQLIASEPRPSWREELSQHSTHLPGWYRKSLELDDEKFWDGKFGSGFNAWYLENIFERAYPPTAPTTTRSAIQLMLPGLETHGHYALD